jgi:hypothetical protein
LEHLNRGVARCTFDNQDQAAVFFEDRHGLGLSLKQHKPKLQPVDMSKPPHAPIQA